MAKKKKRKAVSEDKEDYERMERRKKAMHGAKKAGLCPKKKCK